MNAAPAAVPDAVLAVRHREPDELRAARVSHLAFAGTVEHAGGHRHNNPRLPATADGSRAGGGDRRQVCRGRRRGAAPGRPLVRQGFAKGVCLTPEQDREAQRPPLGARLKE